MSNINSYIVFFSQVIMCYIIIITCLTCIVTNTAISKEYSNLFLSLTSSSIGYLLPNPTTKTSSPANPPAVDEPDNASSSTTTSSSRWRLFGKKVAKADIVFISQITICYVIILVSIGCLAVGEPSPNDYLFTILTSSTLGILLPSPRLKAKQDGLSGNAA